MSFITLGQSIAELTERKRRGCGWGEARMGGTCMCLQRGD